MFDQMMIQAADQSTKSYELLDTVSQNLGNYNTYGYKAVRFDQYMRPDGNVDEIKRVDTSQGPIGLTNRELDVAINGPGYMQVTRPDGTTAYTRNGSLAKNSEGYLVTPHGDLVGTGIQVPARYSKLAIRPDGQVDMIETPGGQPKALGTIPLVTFPNPEGLKNIGGNLMVANADSGTPDKVENGHSIQQGHLEYSNINIHYAVEDILRINTGVVANLRILKAVDDTYKEAIQLRQ
jgi:flagellar basal-body rod protein FlgG